MTASNCFYISASLLALSLSLSNLDSLFLEFLYLERVLRGLAGPFCKWARQTGSPLVRVSQLRFHQGFLRLACDGAHRQDLRFRSPLVWIVALLPLPVEAL